MKNNPLLEISRLPFGAPPFDKIHIEHYKPAFVEAIARAKEEVAAIADNSAEPDFANTIEALEYSGMDLTRVEGIFFNLLEADSNETMQQIAEEVSPMLTELSLYISLNVKLFERVKKVWSVKGELELDVEETRLLEDTYRSFTRGGAGLDEEQKIVFGKWSEQLSLLELKFSNNVLAATNAFSMLLESPDDLEGLPQYVVEAAAHAAEEQGKKGWLFTLQAPSFSPFMKYSGRRDLREKMYMAYHSRSVGGDYDNTQVIKDIVRLRTDIAHLLGYPSYAEYALEERMAKHQKTVQFFLDGLMADSLPFAQEEVAEITAYAHENGFEEEQLAPWDFSYWAEKYQQVKYDLDEALLKPYFKLENCIDAVLGLASRLYGISFNERHDLPVYHEDVKVFDVQDENGEHLALFYADFFPRASKRGGAWMTEFMGQYQQDGKDFRPFTSIVTNFSKPTGEVPSLLTHGELTTFLHEFGHSLHGILSRGRFPSMCGTNVARDFVEMPSQIMENWGFEPEFLNGFAKDYRTGETIPSEYIDRIVAAKNYLSGYYQVRQLHFGIIDMAWHTLDQMFEGSAIDFENKVLGPYRVLPVAPGTAICPSFGHIFSGGYSSGYYSYKWAEVLEADAFSLFKEKGIFNREVADRFRRNILERGSFDDEAVLYRNFRGRDPRTSSLMESLGLVRK